MVGEVAGTRCPSPVPIYLLSSVEPYAILLRLFEPRGGNHDGRSQKPKTP